VAPPADRTITRAPTWGDTVTEIGLVAVPSLAGAAGGPWGLLAGGAAGELLREAYQQWSGTRTDGISPWNVAAQAGINLVPGGRMAGAVARKAAPALAESVSPLAGRLLTSAAEGSLAGVASTTAERVIRDQDLPSVPELGLSAVAGAGFGTAFGAGAEALRVRKLGAKAPSSPTDALFLVRQFLAAAPGEKSAAAQAIYDHAETLRLAGDPEGAAGLLQELLGGVRTFEQEQLTGAAQAFLREYGSRVDQLTGPQRQELTRDFLSGLRDRGLADQALAETERILGELHAATPEPLYGPVEGPATRAAQPLPGPENYGQTTAADL